MKRVRLYGEDQPPRIKLQRRHDQPRKKRKEPPVPVAYVDIPEPDPNRIAIRRRKWHIDELSIFKGLMDVIYQGDSVEQLYAVGLAKAMLNRSTRVQKYYREQQAIQAQLQKHAMFKGWKLVEPNLESE